ncbi:helix-turn-helix transcriptional regulator [Corynebacterium diphtheriae]|uniref:helix-turn-helix domain-containing protein n=1 Tax=Corynebacterium diphtheriae TaxID=1717 RepID=UPI00403D62A1
MTETKPTHGRAPRPKPRALYPAWPEDPAATGAHSLVQAFVRNLAAYVAEQAGHGVSQTELARRADVAKATLSKVLRGDVWPDSVTVARFEHLAGRRLWDGPISVTSPDQPSEHADTDTDTD